MKEKNLSETPDIKVKKIRSKKYYARKMVKDLKRVRWPDAKKNWQSFFRIIVFTILVVLFIFVTTTVFTLIWAYLKVGP